VQETIYPQINALTWRATANRSPSCAAASCGDPMRSLKQTEGKHVGPMASSNFAHYYHCKQDPKITYCIESLLRGNRATSEIINEAKPTTTAARAAAAVAKSTTAAKITTVYGSNNSSRSVVTMKQKEVISIKKTSESCLEMAEVQHFFYFKNKIKNTVVELNVTYCRKTRPRLGLS
jgi:hypothetical protein